MSAVLLTQLIRQRLSSENGVPSIVRRSTVQSYGYGIGFEVNEFTAFFTVQHPLSFDYFSVQIRGRARFGRLDMNATLWFNDYGEFVTQSMQLGVSKFSTSNPAGAEATAAAVTEAFLRCIAQFSAEIESHPCRHCSLEEVAV